MKNSRLACIAPGFRFPFVPFSFVVIVVVSLCAHTACANVYATNIRLNGGFSNVQQLTVTNVEITYVLNEAATLGVSIDIKIGTNSIRTLTLENSSPGTLQGSNVVVWDGTDNNGTNVGPGIYQAAITARSSGYADWTEITDTNNFNNYIWEPRGVAINRNTGSPYYGRVFVSNAHAGPNDGATPGDTVGLLKFNSDLSPADESVDFWSTTGGVSNWAGDYFSPWKIEVGADDKTYVSDRTAGMVLSFDQLLASNSLNVVLTTNNFPSAAGRLSGPSITGTGSNTFIWLADASGTGSLGILRWQVGANGSVASNDLGTSIIQAGSASPSVLSAPAYGSGQFQFTLSGQAGGSYIIESSTDLRNWTAISTNTLLTNDQTITTAVAGARSYYRAITLGSTSDLAPYDVAVDSSNHIYTIQLILDKTDPADRLFRFPPYFGTPISTPDWMVGSGDDTMEGAYGVAVDPVARYVAVAFVGDGWGGGAGGISGGAAGVFATTNGSAITTLTPSTTHSFTDVGWDNVGNLYGLDQYDGIVRVYSPPDGTNQATTVAVPLIQIGNIVSSPPPNLIAPTYANGQFQFTLNGQANVAYIIEASSDLKNWAPVLTNDSASANRPIVLSAPAARSFYRAYLAQ